ncbi:MAG: DUF4129 domain-containing protein [Acidobacteria bacterium]|nr:DUF4129 domain-containing protein [Acidobacteriota bacterium]
MKFVLSSLVLLIAAASAFGGTLTDYRNAIGDARIKIDKLIVMAEDGEDEVSLRGHQAEIRDLFAKPESKLRRIDFDGTSVEIDNRWVLEKLAQIEQSPAKRIDVLNEIDERLAAVVGKISELESSVAGGNTKDADKQKLAEILKRIEFQKPEPPKESWLDRIRKAIDRWLNDNFPEMQVPEGASEGMRSTSLVLQILLYAVIIGAVGFMLYKFAPFLASKLRRFEREEKEDRVILGERIAGNEDAGTLFGEAERLAREGNLRGAVRKGYVALLCDLSDRKLIGLARHKTNRDYLRDVRKHAPLHQNMNGMTNSFERHWYGFEEVTPVEWEEFRNGYKRTVEAAKQ